ncbi:MAG: hypothetical protein AAGC58_10340 [Asticcacaulis sp.]
MKLYVPFYSRVYSILSKMKIKPWVEGNEKVASETTATTLIIFHQYLFLFFLQMNLQKNILVLIFLVPIFFSYENLYISTGIFFLINFLIFQVFGKPVERNKIKDYVSIIIFSTSSIFLYIFFFFKA